MVKIILTLITISRDSREPRGSRERPRRPSRTPFTRRIPASSCRWTRRYYLQVSSNSKLSRTYSIDRDDIEKQDQSTPYGNGTHFKAFGRLYACPSQRRSLLPIRHNLSSRQCNIRFQKQKDYALLLNGRLGICDRNENYFLPNERD